MLIGVLLGCSVGAFVLLGISSTPVDFAEESTYLWSMLLLGFISYSIAEYTSRIVKSYKQRKANPTPNRKLHLKQEAKKKNLMAVAGSRRLVDKLNKRKDEYREKIEKALEKDSQAEEANIDRFLQKIAEFDSQIEAAQQIKSNLEIEGRNLDLEIADLENELRPERDFGLRRRAAAEAEAFVQQERGNFEVIERNEPINHITLEDIRQAQHELRLNTLRQVRSSLNDIVQAVREQGYLEHPRYQPIMADIRTLLNGLPHRQDAEAAIDEARAIITNCQLVTTEIAHEQSNDDSDDDHMGTDGYPICPHCSVEHNNCGTHYYPYCSEHCHYEGTHCRCGKELDEDADWDERFCSYDCFQNALNEMGNGD